jgi:hypothetical protein
MGRMRVLILVDRLHSSETLAAVSRLVELGEAEVLLAYVEGPASRAGLELMRQGPAARFIADHCRTPVLLLRSG